MAPEIVQKTEFCGPPTDIYASGVLLFAFFVGSFLIEDKTIKNFIVRFQLGILSSLIMFQLVLDKL